MPLPHAGGGGGEGVVPRVLALAIGCAELRGICNQDGCILFYVEQFKGSGVYRVAFPLRVLAYVSICCVACLAIRFADEGYELVLFKYWLKYRREGH